MKGSRPASTRGGASRRILARTSQHGRETADQIAHDMRLHAGRTVGDALVLGRVVHDADVILSGVLLRHEAANPGSIDGRTMVRARGIGS